MERLSALPFTPADRPTVTSDYLIREDCRLIRVIQKDEFSVTIRSYLDSNHVFEQPMNSKRLNIFTVNPVNFIEFIEVRQIFDRTKQAPAVVLVKRELDNKMYVLPYHHQNFVQE